MTESKFGWIEQYTATYNRTESPVQDLNRPDLPELNIPRALHACLGLASELAEFEEAMTARHRMEEMGDLIWFTTLLAEALAQDPNRVWQSAALIASQSVYDRDRPGLMVELGHAVGAVCDRLKAVLFYQSTEVKPFYAYGQEFKSEKVPAMDGLRACTERVATALAQLGDSLGLEHGAPGAGLRAAMISNLAKLEVRHQNQPVKTDARDYEKEAEAMDRSLEGAQH
jgi:hypothetical protein